jgi:hypothetical protein
VLPAQLIFPATVSGLLGSDGPLPFPYLREGGGSAGTPLATQAVMISQDSSVECLASGSAG